MEIMLESAINRIIVLLYEREGNFLSGREIQKLLDLPGYTINQAIRHLATEKLIDLIEENRERPFGFGSARINELGRKKYREIIASSFQVNDTRLSEDARAAEMRSFIRQLNCDCYVVGSIWEGDNQLERFFEEQIWETGYEDKFQDIISKINPNDVLIVKSTFAAAGVSYLRVKALGRVTGNPTNGTRVLVNWLVKDLSIDIEDLGYYRNTITQLGEDDLFTIFSEISPQDRDKLLTAASTLPGDGGGHSITIPGLLSDTDSGVDYLDIGTDVLAFARVMAAKSFQPPLAIALLGRWGAGKSFFMRKVQEQILKLSADASTDAFCSGIVHIPFNAWSYMDANLWASIVTKIFEGLYLYISNDTKATIHKKEIEKTFLDKLTSSQQQIKDLAKQKETLQSLLDELNKKKQKVAAELGEKIQKIGNKTIKKILQEVDDIFKASEKITEALDKNESFRESKKEFTKLIPEEYWDDPVETYKQLRSGAAFIRAFFRSGKWWTNALWIAIPVAIIAGLPHLLTLVLQKTGVMDFTLSPQLIYLLTIAGALIARLKTTYQRIKPWLVSIWKIKGQYELERSNALSQFEQEEKVLKLQIETGENELSALNLQIQQTTALKSNFEYRINNTLSTEALYSFIEKRKQAEDYQKHLGIISIIRNDLETLSDLFNAHIAEYQKSTDQRVFTSYFDKPLERIILYIDDLDRCPEERVVEVLEAVNLLMAYPLFTVIVGVDPRWVRNALLKKHPLQFNLTASDVGRPEPDLIDPVAYLEKIFQIPFHLRPPELVSIREMIAKLAGHRPGPTANRLAEQLNNDHSEENAKQADNSTGKPSPAVQDPTPNLPPPVTTTTFLAFTDQEIMMMQDISEIIGDNPRAIKRFVNIYRIVKAHEQFSYETRTEEVELLVVMLLIAISVGKYRELQNVLEAYLENDKFNERLFSGFLQSADRSNSKRMTDLKNQLNVTLSDKRNFQLLEQEPIVTFKKHLGFIKRFSFNIPF